MRACVRGCVIVRSSILSFENHSFDASTFRSWGFFYVGTKSSFLLILDPWSLILDSGDPWSLKLDPWSSCVRGCVIVGCCLWLFYGCFMAVLCLFYHCFITVLCLFYACCIVDHSFTSVPLMVCSWLLRLACVRAYVRSGSTKWKEGTTCPPLTA